MLTDSVSPAVLASSVIAVPPLARNADLTLNQTENQRLVRHIESGGVSTLLYGGNANFYHVAVSEYARLLTMLCEIVSERALVIPSVGPAYGTMMDQAAILNDFDFPTAMVLPSRDMMTAKGLATGIKHFTDTVGRPIVLYIKHEGTIDVQTASRLASDGMVSAIKYAIVRDDPAEDAYLSELVQQVDPKRIVSGIGEQPAIVHMRDFGLCGFTSGCVCVAPAKSMVMLAHIQAGDFEAAEQIRRTFQPLEDHRNRINPVRVLHEAVKLAGIADTGPLLPLLSPISAEQSSMVAQAARQLLARERATIEVD